MTTYNRNLFVWFAVVTLASLVALYFAVDAISLTLPPWDYCGWHETKAGTAFDCIRFDVTPVTLK